MRHMKIITFFGRLPSDKIKSPTNRMATCTTPHQTIWSQHLHHQRDNVLTTTFSTRGTARKASYFIKHLRHKESIANFHHISTNTCSTRHTAQHLSSKIWGPPATRQTYHTTATVCIRRSQQQLINLIKFTSRCGARNLVELLAPACPQTFSSYACWLLRTLDSVVPMSRVSELPWTLDTSAPMRPLSHCRKVASILHDMLGKCPK